MADDKPFRRSLQMFTSSKCSATGEASVKKASSRSWNASGMPAIGKKANAGSIFIRKSTRDTVGEDSPLLPRLSTQHHSGPCSKEDRTQPADTASVWKKCRQIARVVPFAYVQFWMAALLSLTPAYFPPLAASKGLEAWQYGFVFSAFSVAVLPGTLLAQKLIARGWSRTGYLGGLAFLILFCFAFGTLYWIPDGGMFLALSMFLILVKGVFATTYAVCTFGIITFAFTKTQGLFIAMLHCLLQIGKVSGSSLGGILIDVWAFPAPFYAIGIAFALSILPMVMLNPEKLGKEEAVAATTPPRVPENEWRYYRLLRHPMFAINLLTTRILSLIANFDSPTLEPYLSQFNLTNAEIGTVFTANYVANCGGSLLAGITSSYKVEKLCIFVGCILSTLSCVIIGPAPFLPYKPTLAFVYVAQVLRGIGASVTEVCVYTGVLRYIIEVAGYPNTIQTNGFVASIGHQSTIITSIAIPPMAGYLASTYGYRNGTMFIFAILSIWTTVTGFVWLKSECHRFGTDRTQYNALLQDDPGH